MGDVLCTIKVMPAGVDVDLAAVEEKIRGLISPEKIEVKPVAFGLKALEVSKIIPDGQGGPDDLEEKLRTIEGVESVETVGVTLV